MSAARAAHGDRCPWRAFAHRCLADHPQRLSKQQQQLCANFVEHDWRRPTLQQFLMLRRIALRCGVELPGAMR